MNLQLEKRIEEHLGERGWWVRAGQASKAERRRNNQTRKENDPGSPSTEASNPCTAKTLIFHDISHLRIALSF
jgi:hypothetical protein